MKALLTAATLLLAFAGAHAGEVYKTTDAQGRPVYTDKPRACRPSGSMCSPRPPTWSRYRNATSRR